MGTKAVTPPQQPERQTGQQQPARWPFDPMQPGDHEPVPAPENESVLAPESARRIEKQSPSTTKRREP